MLILAFVAGVIVFTIGYLMGSIISRIKQEIVWQKKIPQIRKEAISKSRAVLGGQFSEQLAPYLPDFPFKPTEVCFLGKPIDFIAFEGMDEKNITGVTFVEVKSGNAKLNSQQVHLKEAINNKKVSFYEYRIPKDLTE